MALAEEAYEREQARRERAVAQAQQTQTAPEASEETIATSEKLVVGPIETEAAPRATRGATKENACAPNEAPLSDEDESEDFDALLLEYADEIATHEREKDLATNEKRTEVIYVVAEG